MGDVSGILIKPAKGTLLIVDNETKKLLLYVRTTSTRPFKDTTYKEIKSFEEIAKLLQRILVRGKAREVELTELDYKVLASIIKTDMSNEDKIRAITSYLRGLSKRQLDDRTEE